MVATGCKTVAETTWHTLCIKGEALPALTSFWDEQDRVASPASQSQGSLRTRETTWWEEGRDFLGKW